MTKTKALPSQPAKRSGPDASTETAIRTASLIAKAIQPSVGDFCEVVVHDFRDLKKSVVAYEGNVTGRDVGAPVTPLSLEILSNKETTIIADRMLRTDDGRIIKSTVAALKNADGETVGSFCFNLDVSNLTYALHALESLAGAAQESRPYTFPEDLPELITTIMDQEERRLGRSLIGLDAKARQSVILSLDSHQIFAIRKSANLVADRLGVSRATVYSDLDKVRR